MAKKKRLASAAIQLLDLVYDSACKANGHSWERINHAMREALEMACGAGFAFHEDDMERIFDNYKSGYWIGESDEWVYAAAVVAGNMQAIRSYEKVKGREPFIATEVRLPTRPAEQYMHGVHDRQKERLVVNARFKWQGVEVRVTSFAKDSSYINCCSYKPRKKGEYGDKIDKRFKITRQELLENRAMDRERKSLVERIRRCGSDLKRSEVACALRIKRTTDLDTIPLERLRKVVEKHLPKPPAAPRPKAVAITREHIEAALRSTTCPTARLMIYWYKPGTLSSKITKRHREWLISNCPRVAQELGFIQTAEAVA